MERVLVTGASGYLGSWVVKTLLDKGYSVNGTVRDLQSATKISHLHKMSRDYDSRLNLYEADLMSKDGFVLAMENCDFVIHTASPFILGRIKEPFKQLINPAKLGTRHVLEVINSTESVRKLVLTSSIVAAYGDLADLAGFPDNKISEKTWNTSSSKDHRPYSYSKVLAEKEAWKNAGKQKRWSLAVVNPGFILGPSLSSRTDGASMNVMMSLLRGKYKTGVPDLELAMVDVRDVALAHVAAMEADAKGRFITASEKGSFIGLSEIIESVFPGRYQLPKKSLPKLGLYALGPRNGFSWKFINNNIGFPMNFDNSRVQRELNLIFRPLEETVRDHVTQIQNDKLMA